MTNITFDGVRVLGAESERKASYHTCTGTYTWERPRKKYLRRYLPLSHLGRHSSLVLIDSVYLCLETYWRVIKFDSVQPNMIQSHFISWTILWEWEQGWNYCTNLRSWKNVQWSTKTDIFCQLSLTLSSTWQIWKCFKTRFQKCIFFNIVSLIMNLRTILSGVASGVALGDTSPVPPCFEDRTNYKPENWYSLNINC